MTNESFPRRKMLMVIGAGVMLGACGGGNPDCSNPPGLTDEQRTQRRALSYVDRTPNPSQRCDVCNFFTPTAPNACGGCQLNLGNVSPQGYCSSFVAKA